jgi:hypothetical protein
MVISKFEDQFFLFFLYPIGGATFENLQMLCANKLIQPWT